MNKELTNFKKKKLKTKYQLFHNNNKDNKINKFNNLKNKML